MPTDKPSPTPASTDHPLDCLVRPALPDPDLGPYTWIRNKRAGFVSLTIHDYPEQRLAIEHAGGAWDPDAEVWRLGNQKKRDALQRELDDARGAVGLAVVVRVDLPPGLTRIGAAFWTEASKRPAVGRFVDSGRLVEVGDPLDLRPADLREQIEATGTPKSLRALLSLELPVDAIKLVQRQAERLGITREALLADRL